MSNTFKGCTAILGIVALSSAAFADGLSAQRINIDMFPRVEVPTVQTVDDRASVLCWNNGMADNITAHQSQETNLGNFYTADDFFVKAGFYKYVDTITVCMLVSDNITGIMVKPNVGLKILGDCNGAPDDATVVCDIAAVTPGFPEPNGVTSTLVGPSATFPGFNEWTFTFEVKKFFAGYTRLWVIPYGVADFQDGMYFWRSANMGQIQGAMGHIKNGAQPWQNVQECDCPGICTDFCFTIDGHLCCLLKNNTPFDATGGAKSLQLFGANIDTSRAVDNFQVGPYNRIELCRIEAWMATNCPLDKVFFEIYENNCNMPGAKLLTSPAFPDNDDDGVADFPIVTDTGSDYLTCNIYHFVWPELNAIGLDPGRDYWISIVAQGTGSILDKAYWMYLATGTCNINITEGKVKDPAVPGLEDFTFVSVATSGAPRDFAFQIYSNEVGARSEDPTNEGEGNVDDTANGNSPLAPATINPMSPISRLVR